MRVLPILILLAACGGGTPPQPEGAPATHAEEPPPAPPQRAVDTPSLSAVPADSSQRSLPQDTAAPPKKRTRPSAPPEQPCLEESRVVNNAARITAYIPKKQLAARMSEIRDQLPGLYTYAEQVAPRSIADDFERGVSRERSSMPDTLPVEVLVYERCNARSPHTALHLRVWRHADGSFGSDGW